MIRRRRRPPSGAGRRRARHRAMNAAAGQTAKAPISRSPTGSPRPCNSSSQLLCALVAICRTDRSSRRDTWETPARRSRAPKAQQRRVGARAPGQGVGRQTSSGRSRPRRQTFGEKIPVGKQRGADRQRGCDEAEPRADRVLSPPHGRQRQQHHGPRQRPLTCPARDPDRTRAMPITKAHSSHRPPAPTVTTVSRPHLRPRDALRPPPPPMKALMARDSAAHRPIPA